MGRVNKGIKGRIRAKLKQEYITNIKENEQIFAAVMDRDFGFIEYDIYVAEFGEAQDREEYIVVDFNIMSGTFAECKRYLTNFKKEIKNHFGFKADNFFSVQYDKI